LVNHLPILRSDQTSVRLPFRLNQPITIRSRFVRLPVSFKKNGARAFRVLAPTLVALSFTGVAHAQGTMDFSGAQTLMGTFKTILDILKKAGGWHPGQYLKIDNAPYMELVIEAMDESGPMGLPAISVAHYGEQNGDLMRDPEMCFELGVAGGAHLDPWYWLC
jgi:hypothetical protein